MTRTADNTAWAILAQHRYAQETMIVMSNLNRQRVDSFNLPREEHDLTHSWLWGLPDEQTEEAA